MYDIPIIMLLTNTITNFYDVMSKSRVILWVVYTFSLKGLEEVEKMVRNWIHFASVSKIIKDEWL